MENCIKAIITNHIDETNIFCSLFLALFAAYSCFALIVLPLKSEDPDDDTIFRGKVMFFCLMVSFIVSFWVPALWSIRLVFLSLLINAVVKLYYSGRYFLHSKRKCSGLGVYFFRLQTKLMIKHIIETLSVAIIFVLCFLIL